MLNDICVDSDVDDDCDIVDVVGSASHDDDDDDDDDNDNDDSDDNDSDENVEDDNDDNDATVPEQGKTMWIPEVNNHNMMDAIILQPMCAEML